MTFRATPAASVAPEENLGSAGGRSDPLAVREAMVSGASAMARCAPQVSDALKILVIDDDPVDARAAARALKALGRPIVLETAADEAEALARALALQPDLVLLDMQLGIQGGEEVVLALREQGCDAAVILLTGTSDPERVAAGMRAGALDYLPKSALDPNRLGEVVRFATRVLQAERDLVRARAIAKRRSEQLARLADVSVEIATLTALGEVLEAIGRAATEIFGGAVSVKLEREDHPPLVLVSDEASAIDAEERTDRIELDLGGAGSGISGRLEITRGEPFDDSERLVALQLARICVTGADKLLLLETAQENARERQEIVAVVSHDLRTPLQSLSLGLDAVALRTAKHPEASALEPTFARMRRSIAAMSRLLGDLLDVSRIHDRAIALRPSAVDPAAILHDIREQHAPIAQRQGLEITEEVVGAGTMHADGARIAQALANLVSNALRHTQKGSIHLRVVLEEERVRFEVRDTGAGVPPEVRARLFERLYQAGTQSTGAAGGLGLGLFIVKGIVDAHRGRVGLDSELGRGSTFYFELPREPLTASPPASSSGSSSP